MTYPTTPDGRYFVTRGRLWRCSNPNLSPAHRRDLTRELMAARREIYQAMQAGDEDAEDRARAEVRKVKQALGERGPVWWTDGAPDLNRQLVKNSPYASWFAKFEKENSQKM